MAHGQFISASGNSRGGRVGAATPSAFTPKTRLVSPWQEAQERRIDIMLDRVADPTPVTLPSLNGWGCDPETITDIQTHHYTPIGLPTIHNSAAVTTPEERRQARAHQDRLARIAKAGRHDDQIVRPVAPEKPEPVFSMGNWIERQKQIHEPYKKLWFSIVEEIEQPKPRHPTVREIQAASEKHFGISHREIISARRTAQVVRPRQVAMYLARTLTLRSLPDIGRQFGGRDHTTVLHAFRKIGALVASDSVVAMDVDAISAVLPRPELAEAAF